MNPRRKWAFRILAPSLILLLAAGAEVTLRLVGWPQSGPAPTTPEGYSSDYLVVETGQRIDLLERLALDNGPPVVRTSRAMVDSRFMHDLTFTVEPAQGVKRIFCLGGSATYGVPHEASPGLPFPDRLEHYLIKAGIKAEVINLGGASFGSDQVLQIVSELVDLGAAAIVVYSANNEFFNYQLKLLERNHGWIYREASGIRLVQALLALVGRDQEGESVTPSDAKSPEEQQRQMVAAALSDTFVRHGTAALPAREGGRMVRRDPHYKNVISRYEANLSKIIELAGKAKQPPLVVLAEVPSYLLHKPWLSLNNPGVDKASHNALVARGEALLKVNNEAEVAVKVLTQAVQMDPTHAEAHFQLARAYLAQGKATQAVGSLRDALEMDMEQGRPVAALGKVVRKLASGGKALWVSMEPIMRQEEDPRRGRDFFHDSCHLTEKGYDLLGEAVAKVLGPKLKGVTPPPPGDTKP